MDKSIYEQITNLLEKSQKILILTHAKADCDGLGASISAYLALRELGKEVTVATNDPAPENLMFLPNMNIVKNTLAGTKDFIITLDSSKTAIGKIRYNIEGNKVNIIITPKDGAFSQNDVSFSAGAHQFDLVIVMDAGNLEHLGALYDQNVEVFYETPVINIDHHASNTDFGKVNAVDVTASSTTEILFDFLEYLEKKYSKKLITEDVATLLLAGIITDTGSFQHANTSPRAMETSAKLLDLGARQQEVIKNIFKTKKLSTLKLWGSILSKVQVDPAYRMVWSAISKDDLIDADADPAESEGIIDDLLTNAPGAEIIFLIKENPEYVSVSMRSTNNQTDVGKFCADNGGGGHVRAAGFKVHSNKPFDIIASEVVSKVRAYQGSRLNIHEEPRLQPDANQMRFNLPIQPQNSQNKAITETPKDEKVTYLDFKLKKDEPQKEAEPMAKIEAQPQASPEIAIKPEPTVKPEQPKAETQPAPKPASSVAPINQASPAMPTESSAKKRRRRRRKNKSALIANPTVTQANQTAVNPAPQPKAKPEAPFVEPV